MDLGEETASLDFNEGGTLKDDVDLKFDAIKIGASYKLSGYDRGIEPLK